MTNIGDRIRSARLAKGFTQPELARECGWQTQSRVSNYERGDREPKSSDVRALGKALNVSEAWLWTGDGASLSGHSTGREDLKTRDPEVLWSSNKRDELKFIGHMDVWDSNTPLDPDEVELPLYREVQLSAGAGQTQVQENHGAKLRFAKSTLSRANIAPDNAACAFVSGNSMEPVMPDGTTVGVNTADTSVRDGEIYALDHDGMLRVKFLYRKPGSGLMIRSQNQEEHPDEHYTLQEIHEQNIRVIGRVFWWSVLR